ncbi:unnamed protein product [Ixodes pacificus]
MSLKSCSSNLLKKLKCTVTLSSVLFSVIEQIDRSICMFRNTYSDTFFFLATVIYMKLNLIYLLFKKKIMIFVPTLLCLHCFTIRWTAEDATSHRNQSNAMRVPHDFWVKRSDTPSARLRDALIALD